MSFDHLESTCPDAPLSPEIREAAKEPAVESVCRLSESILLLLVRWNGTERGSREPVAASAVLANRSIPLESEGVWFTSGLRQSTLLVRAVLPSGNNEEPRAVEIACGPAVLSADFPRNAASQTDVRSLLLHGLAGAETADRKRLMDFIAMTTRWQNGAEKPASLGKALHRIREGLRDHHPRSAVGPELPRGLHVDALLRIDAHSFYIRGWMFDQESEIAALRAISPEGAQSDLLERFFPYNRPDVDRFRGLADSEGRNATGFISFFELEAPSLLEKEWILQSRNRHEDCLETSASVTATDPATARRSILEDLAHSTESGELMARHIHPAIQRLLAREQERQAVDEVRQYGEPCEKPEISIVVPLYRRIDFVEQQLAQFFLDSEIQCSDLIYVLDSPELSDALHDSALQLSQLYRVPFRVVTLQRNSGFSAANNFGASLARGRKLLFLNSDVLPDSPGWLRRMSTFYDSIPAIGALGAKLLYEDDSVQHAGIFFRRDMRSGNWENLHYFKGLHRSLPAANISREVPAVTGACLMIDRELFESEGGFRSAFVQGDFEDTDLCLRLVRCGRRNWYCHAVELYHLEGQSYPTPLRQQVNQYNRRLHTQLWNEEIERLMLEEFRIVPPDEVRTAKQESTLEPGKDRDS